jgi:hypothetical protein
VIGIFFLGFVQIFLVGLLGEYIKRHPHSTAAIDRSLLKSHDTEPQSIRSPTTLARRQILPQPDCCGTSRRIRSPGRSPPRICTCPS